MNKLVPIAMVIAAATLTSHRVAQSVLVVGTDYAFRVPEHIHAGETIFTFENRGSVRHELSLALLKEGFGADSVLTSLAKGSPRRNWLDGQAALIVSRPADAPGPGLWLKLEAGRTYFVICTLRDTPEAQPHLMLGMLSSFRVEP